MKPYEPITDAAQLYMRLTLDYGAITLSTAPSYNTFQLVATPFNAAGEPMLGLPAPTFRYANANDSTKVKLSPSGLLTAVNPGTDIKIIAEVVAANNVRHVDTAFVNVNVTTNPPPALATLTLDPGPPDSTILSQLGAPLKVLTWLIDGGFLRGGASYPSLKFFRRGLTAEGDSIPKLAVEYFALDPTIANVDRRTGKVVLGVVVGRARMIARTMAYGIARTDTTVFTITESAYQTVTIKDGDPNQSIFGFPKVIRPGGVVFWFNQLNPVDIAFDDPTAASLPPASICTAANMDRFSPAPTDVCAADLSFAKGEYRVRQFLAAGIYTYRDMLSGAVGTIVVADSL